MDAERAQRVAEREAEREAYEMREAAREERERKTNEHWAWMFQVSSCP